MARSDPILATKEIRMERERRPCLLTVFGGLCYHSGNRAPFFTLTSDVRIVGGPSVEGGANHALILQHLPQFADLARLHLSDMDGAPSYAVENGFYHLGGFTEHYTGNKWGRAPDHKYEANYPAAARLLRISEDEARALVRDLFGVSFSETAGFLSPSAEADAKARFAQWCETQRPRWKAEADACIAAHRLVIFGDPWDNNETL